MVLKLSIEIERMHGSLWDERMQSDAAAIDHSFFILSRRGNSKLVPFFHGTMLLLDRHTQM